MGKWLRRRDPIRGSVHNRTAPSLDSGASMTLEKLPGAMLVRGWWCGSKVLAKVAPECAEKVNGVRLGR